MATLAENANPKHNPVTTTLGTIFVTISAMMYIMKYVLPAFIVFKQDLPYEWYTPILPLAIGILLLFINDDYFNRIFNRADKVAAKKTETE